MFITVNLRESGNIYFSFNLVLSVIQNNSYFQSTTTKSAQHPLNAKSAEQWSVDFTPEYCHSVTAPCHSSQSFADADPGAIFKFTRSN